MLIYQRVNTNDLSQPFISGSMKAPSGHHSHIFGVPDFEAGSTLKYTIL